MKIKVSITKQILEQSKDCGEGEYVTNCAVALAVRDILPDAHVSQILLEDGEACAIQLLNHDLELIELPLPAQIFIDSFDRASPAERLNLPELSFIIDVPQEVIAHIGISQVTEILKTSQTLASIDQAGIPCE